MLNNNNYNELQIWFLKQKLYWLLQFFLPSSLFVSIKYAKRLKKWPNLNNPQTFNEKIQWLKLNYRNELCTQCADKYEVRKFVKNRIGENILNELYGVYSSVDDIDIRQLPDSFVLKVNHGSGQNFFCHNKDEMDWRYTFRALRYCMKVNHFYHGKEWAYKNIKPKIICEKNLSEDGRAPFDYKFFCFDGTPKLIQVDTDRFSRHTRNIYDTNWQLQKFEYEYQNYAKAIVRPQLLEKMLHYASILSKNFPFVRVDFFLPKNKIMFGEMTFYPENGAGRFWPDNFDDILGSYIQLPSNSATN